jgi:hypothetical protein
MSVRCVAVASIAIQCGSGVMTLRFATLLRLQRLTVQLKCAKGMGCVQQIPAYPSVNTHLAQLPTIGQGDTVPSTQLWGITRMPGGDLGGDSSTPGVQEHHTSSFAQTMDITRSRDTKYGTLWLESNSTQLVTTTSTASLINHV